jgi:hypothetical protein
MTRRLEIRHEYLRRFGAEKYERKLLQQRAARPATVEIPDIRPAELPALPPAQPTPFELPASEPFPALPAADPCFVPTRSQLDEPAAKFQVLAELFGFELRLEAPGPDGIVRFELIRRRSAGFSLDTPGKCQAAEGGGMSQDKYHGYLTPEGAMSVFDPDVDLLGLVQLLNPQFHIKSEPPPAWHTPALRQTRQRIAPGLTLDNLHEHATAVLWKQHRQLLDDPPAAAQGEVSLLDLKVELAARELEACRLCGLDCWSSSSAGAACAVKGAKHTMC